MCILDPETPDDRVERAQLAAILGRGVADLDAFDIVGDAAQFLGDLDHVSGLDEMKLGVAIDEAADQPGTGDPVCLGVLTGDPFHRVRPPAVS